LPDPIYNSTLVTKFINGMMWAGKKSAKQGLDEAKKRGDVELEKFEKANKG